MSFVEPTTLGVGIATTAAIAFGVWYFRKRKYKKRKLKAQENI